MSEQDLQLQLLLTLFHFGTEQGGRASKNVHIPHENQTCNLIVQQ